MTPGCLKKVTKELEWYRIELQAALDSKQKIAEENQSLKTQIEVNHAARLGEAVRIEKLESSKNKSIKKMNEMKCHLDREVDLRASLEKSNSSLLNRVQDIELLMEQERAQVKQLDLEYQSLKKEYIQLRNEVAEEQRLRANSEEALKALTEEAESSGTKVGELMSERNLIDGALVQWKKDYLAMETELKEKNRVISEMEEKVKSQSSQISDLQTSLKTANDQTEQMQLDNRSEIEQLHKQYNTALEKQREAVSPAAVEAEKMKTRKLQEKITELGCQMSDYERQQATDCTQLRDQLRQKEAEAKRARSECEELRRMQDKAMGDKEDLLREVNKTVDQLSSDRMKLEYALEETKLELAKVTQSRDHQENENVRLLEEMSSMQIRHTATEQLQSAIVELTQDKNHLTHENTSIKSKLKGKTEELEYLSSAKTELSVVKRQNAAYEAQFTKLNTEINCLKVSLQKSETLVKQYRDRMELSEEEQNAVKRLKDELRETKRCKEEQTLDMDRLREENLNLKSLLDNTSTELTTKLSFINEIEKQRLQSAEMSKRNEEEMIRNYEERLEVLQKQNSSDRDILLKKMKKEQSDLKKSRDDALHRANESAQLVVDLKKRMGELEQDLSKQRDQTQTIKMALDNSQKQKRTITEQNERIKMLSEKLAASDKDKKQYMMQNLDQAKSVTLFSSQITQLEGELQALARLNDESTSLAKRYEGLAAAEREDRTKAENKCTMMVNRCKELESHLIDVTLNNSYSKNNHNNTGRTENRSPPKDECNSGQSIRRDQGTAESNRRSQSYGSKSKNCDSSSKTLAGDYNRQMHHASSLPEYGEESQSLNSSLRSASADLETERQRAVETTNRARLMIQESRETMRRLSERMSLLEHEYPTNYDKLSDEYSHQFNFASTLSPEKD